MSDPRLDGEPQPEEYVPEEWTIDHEAQGLDEEAEKAETVLAGVDRAADVTEHEPTSADDIEVPLADDEDDYFPRDEVFGPEGAEDPGETEYPAGSDE